MARSDSLLGGKPKTMKHKIDEINKTPVEPFLIALHAVDVERVRTLLEDHADVRAAVNEPISYFNSRPVARATKNLPLLDLLLAYGADLNLKSTWWRSEERRVGK